jgi:hypothetical protein
MPQPERNLGVGSALHDGVEDFGRTDGQPAISHLSPDHYLR